MEPDQSPAPQINCSYPCGACECDCFLGASRNEMFQQRIRQRINAVYN